MNQLVPIFKREFLGYFRSPIGYVVLAVFSIFANILGFFVFGFFSRGTATIDAVFLAMPWLFVFLVPAVAMRLWAEEKRVGTVELLFTLPLTTSAAVFGKFLAAWAFITIAILLTFPFLLTVAYLGSPDWGVVSGIYFGTILLAAAYLSLSSLVSALTRNQIIAFVVSALLSLLIMVPGLPDVREFLAAALPTVLVDIISNASFYTHFQPILEGLVDLRAVIYFASVIIVPLLLNVLVLER